MADQNKKIKYTIEINDKGKVKIDGLTEGFVGASNALKTLNKDLIQQGQIMKQNTKANVDMIATSGLAGATLTEVGRTVSDFNYGIRGIANNLSQLSTLFITLVSKAGGFGKAMSILSKQLRGPLGFILAFQFVIMLLESFDMQSEKTKKSSEGLSDVFKDIGSNVSKTAGNFEIYIRTLQDSTKSQEQQNLAIKKLNKEYPDFIKNINEAGFETEDLKNKTNDLNVITNIYRDSLVKLAMARAATTKIQEAAGQAVDARIKATEELKEIGLTLDQARELSAKKDEVRTDKSIASIRKRVRATDEFRTKEIDAADKIIAELDKENIRIQERINLLSKFTVIELSSSKSRTKARKKESEEKNKYDALEIGNFDEKIRALKEMGKIRTYFFNQNLQMDVSERENTIEAIELEEQQNLSRLDALKELGLREEELAVAKYEINLYYTKLLAAEQKRLDEQGFGMRMQMFRHYADSLGSLSGLMKENSKASKTFALLEIATNTAIGFAQGLRVAQQQALSAPPVSTLAFPLFYASQIAAVLAAANKAKSILKGGGPGGGGIGAGSTQVQTPSIEAPDFNVVGASPESQLAQTVAGQQQKPLRAFVVNKDIKTADALDRANQQQSTVSG